MPISRSISPVTQAGDRHIRSRFVPKRDFGKLVSRALRDRGLELTPAVDRLNAFNAVQNTYLDTFEVLGGLGLLLGSVGLGVVVLRSDPGTSRRTGADGRRRLRREFCGGSSSAKRSVARPWPSSGRCRCRARPSARLDFTNRAFILWLGAAALVLILVSGILDVGRRAMALRGEILQALPKRNK